MFQQMKKRIKNEKGLTLIELLAVIVILAIVAAIAIPAIGNIINKSSDKAQISDAINIIAGGKLAHLETNCGTKGCTSTDLEEHVDGIDVSGITVTLSSSNEWTISGYEFDMKTDDFASLTGDQTETTLKDSLDKGKYTGTTTKNPPAGNEE